MNPKSKKGKRISRRGILPIIGGSLLMPFIGLGKASKAASTSTNDEYQTLLKSDGTTVKVKVSTLKKSKVIKKNVSNTSFLNWLGRKL